MGIVTNVGCLGRLSRTYVVRWECRAFNRRAPRPVSIRRMYVSTVLRLGVFNKSPGIGPLCVNLMAVRARLVGAKP